jgi:hypothetical protein
MLGVVKDVLPLNKTEPPVAAAYQSIVSPPPTLAEITTVPVPHLELLTGVFGAAGIVFIVAVTGALVAEIQPAADLVSA